MLYNQSQKEIIASSSEWIDWNDACEDCAYDLNAAASNSAACLVCTSFAPKNEITTYSFFDLPLYLILVICGISTIMAISMRRDKNSHNF